MGCCASTLKLLKRDLGIAPTEKELQPWNESYPSLASAVKKNLPPQKNNRVVIIGAGAAGVHMASLLKHRGFDKVTILEKTNRVGGKSYTVKEENIPHEMGTCFAHCAYDRIFALNEKYGASRVVKPNDRDIYTKGSKEPKLLEDWMYDAVEKIMCCADCSCCPDKLQGLSMFGALILYIRAHYLIFGDYKYGLLPEIGEKKKSTYRYDVLGVALET